jgi:hypothetical protein
VSGLDDATYSGSYTGSTANGFYVAIDAEGAPDTFEFSDNNGDCSGSGVEITGSAQLLCDGISITFASTTGHTQWDEWDYDITASITPQKAINVSDGGNSYFVVNAVANNSNFIGLGAGDSALSATSSNFIGHNAGKNATSATYANFFGEQAGYGATNATNAIFIGANTGVLATDAVSAVFIGGGSGSGAANATRSNFIGSAVGQDATNANDSNFMGYNAGYQATNAYNSNFFGYNAGYQATNAYRSNFFGAFAGYQATSASHSNFFGNQAGINATGANHANFLGEDAGGGATNADNSNFLGYQAGINATSANSSNFFGKQAGASVTNASYSNFLGFRVGANFHNGTNNIIIGTNISLPDGTSNAINIGGVLFGTGTYANTNLGGQSVDPTDGRIGIGVVSPSYTLQVGNSHINGIVARFQNITGTCDINPTTASLSCSSDQTLKKDIVAVPDEMLEKILSLQPVTYHWNSENPSDPTHIGFIAQQVEQVFPDLVTTDSHTGLKSLNYTGLIPYTVKAVQEMGITLQSVPVFEDQTLAIKVQDFLKGIGESGTALIDSIRAKNIHTQELCVGEENDEVCVTKEQLRTLLLQSGSTPSPQESPVVEDAPVDEQPAPDPISQPAPETPTPEAPAGDSPAV